VSLRLHHYPVIEGVVGIIFPEIVGTGIPTMIGN